MYLYIYMCRPIYLHSLYTNVYIYLEPVCPVFLGFNPPKQGPNSNKNKGPHLGSRYIHNICSTWTHINDIIILLVEEILHHLGFKETCKYWDRLPTSTGEFTRFPNYQQFYGRWFLANSFHAFAIFKLRCQATLRPASLCLHCSVVSGMKTTRYRRSCMKKNLPSFEVPFESRGIKLYISCPNEINISPS